MPKNEITEIKQLAKPFLKWAGGKRWFVNSYSKYLPQKYNNYLEPFLGSGAVFFHLRPERSTLSDSNQELIITFQAIKNDWEKVYKKLKEHHYKHSSHYYYHIRNSKPRQNYTRAARLIYLNRTCWNGLYRVNLLGEYNVPKGTKTKVLLDNEDFRIYSEALQNSNILASDFENIIDQAKKNDFLFIDPPYTIHHKNNGFIKYNEKLFSWNDQIRLRDCVLNAKKRGAKILMTNANNINIFELYEKEFKINMVNRSSVIAAKSIFRKMCSEIIIWSY